jgi:hypothetical protein
MTDQSSLTIKCHNQLPTNQSLLVRPKFLVNSQKSRFAEIRSQKIRNGRTAQIQTQTLDLSKQQSGLN